MALYDIDDDDNEDERRKAFGALAGVTEPVDASNAMSAEESAAYANLDDKLTLAGEPAHAEAKPKTFEVPDTAHAAREAVAGPDAGGDDNSSYFAALAGERVSNERARDEANAKEDSFGGHISGWALAADLLLNKGRGIPTILSTANDQASRARSERKELARINASKGDKDAQRSIELSAQALRQRSLANEERRIANDEKYAEHPELKPLTALQQAQLDNLKSDNERSAAQVTSIQADREHDNKLSDDTAAERKRQFDISSNLEAGRNDAASRHAAAVEKAAQITADERRDGKALLHAPIPGTEVADDAAWTAATGTAGARQNIEKAVSHFTTADAALKRMEEIRKEHGTRILDDDAKAEYDLLRSQAIGAYTEIGKTGVLNGAEYARYASQIPGTGITDNIKNDSLDAIKGLVGIGHEDTTLQRLAGVRTATRDAIQQSLSPYGIRHTGVITPPVAEETVIAPKAAAPAADGFVGKPVRGEPVPLKEMDEEDERLLQGWGVRRIGAR